ncbi:hypothetical protein [Desulfatiglans anilini]|uniref:hypothetical protein n=1 Tax=Desulfatiglans anilini TaxID=90728 RepID=UPI0003F54D81|nr:hypothetical protein [Desulfatiglans anilini]
MLKKTLDEAGRKLQQTTPTSHSPEDPAELSADKGYHARKIFKKQEDAHWKTRIAEP